MKTLLKTIKLRALLLVSTLGITWMITGNPTTSVTVTAIQQSTNFGIQYLWEKNEDNKRRPKEKELELDEYHRKYGVD